jgi:hypothetical protein
MLMLKSERTRTDLTNTRELLLYFLFLEILPPVSKYLLVFFFLYEAKEHVYEKCVSFSHINMLQC